MKITKNISFEEARKSVTDRTPQPGISYSAALNTTSVVNKAAIKLDNSTVIIKKSDLLELLEIKKSWTVLTSSNSQNQTTPTIDQTTLPAVIYPSESVEFTSKSPSLAANLFNTTEPPNASSFLDSDALSSNATSPQSNRNTKKPRENKKQGKKTNEWEKAKEAKIQKKQKSLLKGGGLKTFRIPL